MASEPLNGAEAVEQSASPPRTILGLPMLTHARLKRLVKFGLVGVSGVVVNLAVFEFFYRFVAMPGVLAKYQFSVSNALGILVSMFTNFLLNDAWTWGDRVKGARRRDWFGRLAKYYVSASAAAGVQLLVASGAKAFVYGELSLEVPSWVGLSTSSVDIGPTLAVLTGIAVGMSLNFLASHLWAFRDAEVEA